MIPFGYVEQCSTEMSYCVLDAPAPRSRVRVMRERVVAVGGMRLTLAVIGSSHFLELSGDSGFLCELLACRPVDLSGLPSVMERRGVDEWRHSLSRDSVDYRFRIWRETLSPEEFQEETEGLSQEKGTRLVCPFPGGAVTCLDWLVEGSRALVKTHHTFPNELSIVRSRSLIDVAEARVAS